MEAASPIGWQLAHTTWFFDEFVLARLRDGGPPVDPRHRFLFNSYYEAVGSRTPRARRGIVSRPTFAQIQAYRHSVDQRIDRPRVWMSLAAEDPGAADEALASLLLGTHHEEQHQELMITDLKHAFSTHPFEPELGTEDGSMLGIDDHGSGASRPQRFLSFDAGVREIGADESSGSDALAFTFDNEGPRHRVFLEPFAMASRTVSNAEYAEFIEDGGYRHAAHWLSEGWACVQQHGWSAPIYWRRDGAGEFSEYTSRGRRAVVRDAPVRHLSLYEADAYARWRGLRLPTEAEWEVASDQLDDVGVGWEWTSSAYSAYPGFAPLEGALGEYNGKFMSGQFVLRGGSCATAPDHARATYRNFFPPDARWQFSGLRLARDI